MVERGLDAALITKLANVRYLTGFSGSHGAVLLTAGETVLGTDSRYELQAAEEAPDVELFAERKTITALAERAAKKGSGRVGFEAHDVSVELLDRMQNAAPGAEFVSLERVVEQSRQVKDDGELELMRSACAISDRAFRHVLSAIEPGVTEREVARALEERFVEYGADGPGFETIVASGPAGAEPHHRPTDRRLSRGDFVTMDFGARYRGYHADMTRTVVVGEATEWQRELYDVVAEAQRAGREALIPGRELVDVYETARSVIRDAGHDEHFRHGLGHGIGLEVHEQPFIGHEATGTLSAGVPVTIEPGVYLPGQGGVRIEDTLVVRPEGPELLTTSTKELLVL